MWWQICRKLARVKRKNGQLLAAKKPLKLLATWTLAERRSLRDGIVFSIFPSSLERLQEGGNQGRDWNLTPLKRLGSRHSQILYKWYPV